MSKETEIEVIFILHFKILSLCLKLYSLFFNNRIIKNLSFIEKVKLYLNLGLVCLKKYKNLGIIMFNI